MIQVFLLVKIIFFNDGSQNFLIFQPILNTFTMFAGLIESIIARQPKGLSNEKM